MVFFYLLINKKTMKKILFTVLLYLPGLMAPAQQGKKVLIYTKTGGYAHASIPDGIRAVQKIGLEIGFQTDTTSLSEDFNEKNLRNYAAIIFISTSPRLLDSIQKEAFTNYIRAGGGFVGIHGASAGIRPWPWYAKLVGGIFTNHPEPKEGVILNENTLHSASCHFPAQLEWKDEWYNFSDMEKDLHILLSVDEASYTGGEYGSRRHPISWYHDYDGGRAFYTALGHFSYHFTDAFFVQHITEGIKYAMGVN